MPTLSITMTRARVKGVPTPLLMREIVGHRPRRADGRNRVLEDHVIGAAVIDDHGKAIEVLDPALELGSVHHPNGDGELLATDVVEKDVLEVRLGGFWFRCGRQQRSIALSRW